MQVNFFKGTKGVFKACKTPKRKPDYISKSGSKYWYGYNKKGSYVIRKSDHWVKTYHRKGGFFLDGCKRVASCFWCLKGNMWKQANTGKIYFKDLKFMHFEK